MDDRFDDQLRELAGEYNQPPETPREEMWAAIQAMRAGEKEVEKAVETDEAEGTEKVRTFRFYRSFRHIRLPAAIAAILALGFALGRVSDRPAPVPGGPTNVAQQSQPRTSETAYRIATTEHLGQAETFLTLFSASVRRGGNEQLASATARQLLASNRLLLDSPAASDARMRLLLQDLELVLAEIAQLSPQPRSRDLELITEGLEQGGVLTRLRTAVPAGASATQGAL